MKGKAHTSYTAIGLLAFVAFATPSTATHIVFDQLDASLTTGSLAGTHFPVSFSYDADKILPSGDTYISLNSFDFTLLGVPFNRDEIFQGGQVILHDGHIDDVTASYQVLLPAGSPVVNITFGFGTAEGIGYIDRSLQNGTGRYTVASDTVPEASSVELLLVGLPVAAISRFVLKRVG